MNWVCLLSVCYEMFSKMTVLHTDKSFGEYWELIKFCLFHLFYLRGYKMRMMHQTLGVLRHLFSVSPLQLEVRNEV